MKLIAVAAVVACSLPAVAQSAAEDSRTGVSNPPPVAAENSPAQASTDNSYPDGYRPTPPPASMPTTVRPTTTPSEGRRALRPDVDAQIAEPDTTPAPVPSSAYVASGNHRPLPSKVDPDAGIVTEAPPSGPNEFPAGTRFKARMEQTITTTDTQPGTIFTAELVEPILKDGRILIPSGTTLEGRVTEIHGGKRIRGTATIHLEPHKLTLPDGSHYLIHAQVIDTDQHFATRIDSEGTISRRDHIKTTLAVLGASTGTAAVAGAMIGGGVGAVVGAGIGAGISTAWWLKQDRQTTLPKDTGVVFSLNEPIAVGTVTAN
ncbi:hypothetical protein [Granulicella sibirica]|uniref:Uncharacterized protein n=1 Tax=Granulicella sibirica TaxID=2479048 RepID=A0A4Q0SXS2_9BACT|nr:hypothetical protein [Granulicella sibirica]RXH55667.1 hypothetical protein GRAN_2524 [Granulicella sibirica]